ncbi:MAG: DUF4256 domain-containing protein [Lachnospiraceae bacterium]
MPENKELSSNRLTEEQSTDILETLRTRFVKHAERHPNLPWEDVLSRLQQAPQKLWSLYEMERTGGEPDVVGHDTETGTCLFYDCAPETPKGRRSICYDREALESRKAHKPAHNAIDLAAEIGIEMLTEAEYRHLQTLGHFDTKTSSWIQTPPDIRSLGGALFCDYRYGTVFVYHNGADSYYGVRGFRGSLTV